MSLIAESVHLRSREKKQRRKPIPERVKVIVWGRAAGRCQYAGCNDSLIGDAVSGAKHANKAYIGHIVADSKDGPRGHPDLSPLLAHDPDNLMLVCDVHHRVFDREMVPDHTVEVLREMKRRHEARIRIVTAIDEDKGSHVIRYAARIGTNESPVAAGAVRLAMLPERYPLEDGWIDLDLATLELADDEPEFWATHVKSLRRGFTEKVRGRLERGEITRLTVFGLAPIPLLIELGRQISDISTADVRQLLREPKGWKWDHAASPVSLSLRRPSSMHPTVALKLEISAQIGDERVTLVLGEQTSIWSVAADGPHNDIVRRPEDVAAFAKVFRTTLDDIKYTHGDDTVVHVFPAIPVSAAVEAGRSWQPKAHPPAQNLRPEPQAWRLHPRARSGPEGLKETMMNIQSRITTAEAEDYLDALADELEIPEYRYEQAEKSYRNLGNWLNRENSSIRAFGPEVHSQGSFALGTVITPISDAEQYDIDAVCEFKKRSKQAITQKELKRQLGVEVELYRKAQNMNKSAEEHRRCWRLEYADKAQFHMDVTPGVPNAAQARAILARYGADSSWAATAIVITDMESPTYAIISDDWPRSNPRAYRKWFHGRMAAIFEKRKLALQKSVRAGTEPLPDYKVRTPLQSSIMILKRHRDIMFATRPKERPISIIVTTLAAHLYNGQETIAGALYAILNGMHEHIYRVSDGRHVIPNPTDPAENFADKWAKHPERAAAFFEWLERVRNDFARAAALSNAQQIGDSLVKGVGASLADRAKKRAIRKIASPAVLSQGLIRSEAQARSSAVNLQGDRRNA